jgi:hypothetical protein
MEKKKKAVTPSADLLSEMDSLKIFGGTSGTGTSNNCNCVNPGCSNDYLGCACTTTNSMTNCFALCS